MPKLIKSPTKPISETCVAAPNTSPSDVDVRRIELHESSTTIDISDHDDAPVDRLAGMRALLQTANEHLNDFLDLCIEILPKVVNIVVLMLEIVVYARLFLGLFTNPTCFVPLLVVCNVFRFLLKKCTRLQSVI